MNTGYVTSIPRDIRIVPGTIGIPKEGCESVRAAKNKGQSIHAMAEQAINMHGLTFLRALSAPMVKNGPRIELGIHQSAETRRSLLMRLSTLQKVR